MKKLQELIEIVSPLKLKGTNILGKSNALADQLYRLIHSGKITSDDEAMNILYAGQKSKAGLYQLKEKLYGKLLDSTFIIDTTEKNHTDLNLAATYCKKHTAIFEYLSGKGVQHSIFPLGEKILKMAIKFNLPSYVCRVSAILVRKSALIFGDDKLMEYYRNLYISYREMEMLEELSSYYWFNISLNNSKKRVVFDNELIIRATQYADDLEKKMLQKHTCNTFIAYANLRIRSKELENNYNEVIRLVDIFILELAEYKHTAGSYYNTLFAKKLLALITLRRFKEANDTAKKNLKYLREGEKSWFTLLESMIILNFYEKSYKTSFELYFKVTKHRSFKFLQESRKEIFKVYRAYFQFFINIGLLKIPHEYREKKRFRYARFRNEMLIYSKDKKGINITIIVAEFLLLFTEGKYNDANDKIESVRSYTRKHLREDGTFRSYCFLKMLVKLVESNYHKAATMRRTKKLYQKLQNHPPEAKRTSSHVEIVPFEQLWELILERIDNSFRGTFKTMKEKRTEIDTIKIEINSTY